MKAEKRRKLASWWHPMAGEGKKKKRRRREGEDEGKTVVVGIKMDARSQELLTWALVKVAFPIGRPPRPPLRHLRCFGSYWKYVLFSALSLLWKALDYEDLCNQTRTFSCPMILSRRTPRYCPRIATSWKLPHGDMDKFKWARSQVGASFDGLLDEAAVRDSNIQSHVTA